MKYNNIPILEAKYSSILFKTSFLFAINSIYGLYQIKNKKLKFNDVFMTNTLLFITSINYWRNPTYGLRRTVDILMALTNIFYNSYTISHHPNAWICYISIKMLIISYCFSWYYHSNNNKKLGTFYHSMVHLFGNFGNFLILNDFNLFE
jgi:hypothetical protein